VHAADPLIDRQRAVVVAGNVDGADRRQDRTREQPTLDARSVEEQRRADFDALARLGVWRPVWIGETLNAEMHSLHTDSAQSFSPELHL